MRSPLRNLLTFRIVDCDHRGNQTSNDYQKGFGLGLIFQSGLMLILDYVAESRANRYTKEILDFQVQFYPRNREFIQGVSLISNEKDLPILENYSEIRINRKF